MSTTIKNQPAQTSTPSVNLFPLTALLIANLVAVCFALFMLVGLHRKVATPPPTGDDNIVTADRIGGINLDRDRVRIDLINLDGSKVNKVQEISLPLDEGFPEGLSRMQTFMEKMLEEGVLKKNE